MNMMQQWAGCFWRASWQAAVLGILIMAITLGLRGRLGAGWRCGLWILVAIRLMLPTLPGSRWSAFNLMERAPTTASPAVVPLANRTVVTVGYGPLVHDDIGPVSISNTSDLWVIYIGAIWALGFVILLGRRIVVERCSAISIREMPAVLEESVLMVVEKCRAEIKLRRRVHVVKSNTVRTPAVCGFWRTKLILPADLCISNAEWRMVVLHELAHVRRWDLQIDRVLSLVRDLHWFNPAAWLMLHCWRKEREIACDEMAMRIIGRDQRTQYGQAILNLVERFSNLPAAAGAVGLFESRSGLRGRIAAIGKFRRSKFRSVIGLLVLLAFIACMLTDTKAQSATAPTNATQISPAPGGELVRVYDLTDLVLHKIPGVPFTNVPLSDMENPPAHRSPKEIADQHAKALQTLVQALHEAVPAKSWKEHGGNGNIWQISGQDQIIVSQTLANHDTINTVLAQWRHVADMQVNFEAHFITLPNNTNIRANKIAILDGSEVAYLNDEDVKELLAAVREKNGNTAILYPRVTVFVHQEAYIAIETQTAYVSGMIETNQQGAAHYKPQTSIAASGALLQVCPAISPDFKSVAVKFHARDRRLMKLQDALWNKNPQLHIQKPIVDTHEAQMTVNIPNASTLLISLKDTAESSADGVWLLLRPTIIEPKRSGDSPSWELHPKSKGKKAG
ncbi:MAG TPA: M56 family metallopeptidase [Tepidisphaeraceae bacterium]|jgi:bla regulator protein BlaR1